MATYPRFSIVLEETICNHKDCKKIGRCWYGDNDIPYCYNHVLSHIDLYRITKCTHCECEDYQTETTCKKCGGAL